jgi:hypothetical protein
MARKLVWIERHNFQGFGCSQCTWMFKPTGALVGESLDKMKNDFEAQLEREFCAHVCIEQLKSTELKTEWRRRS